MERKLSLSTLPWTALAYALLSQSDGVRLQAEEAIPGQGLQRAVSSRRAWPTQVRFFTTAQQPEPAATTKQAPDTNAGAETVPDNYLRPIGEVNLAVASPEEKLPTDYAARYFDRAGVDRQVIGTSRPWSMSLESWQPTALCHRPLYFEEVNLERYGKSFGIAQPAISAVDMFGRVLAFPYLVGATRPRECIYTLGQGRPGNYMPFYLHRPPVSVRGGLLQATAVTGMAFVVP
jgi:hypothetical protein